MIPRSLQETALRALKTFPVVAILGPRQVGKTTLAKILLKKQKKETHHLDLENSSDYSSILSGAEHYLETFQDSCVLIDEIQRLPDLFTSLRYLVDQNRVAGRFIITGSASPALLKGATESLAGRVIYLSLNPVSCSEIPASITIKKHWFRGGFPLALSGKSDKIWNDWMQSFLSSYIERDLMVLFDVRFSTPLVRKLWTMLAHQQGSILNAENLGNALDITGTTLKRYLDFLEGAFMLFRLQPYFTNIGKRLVKSPKIYIRDSGIVHALLNIRHEKELLNHPVVGHSWEGYVISQIRYIAPEEIQLFFYRTQAGAESDLVLVKANKVIALIEIKYSTSPVISKGFYHSILDLDSPEAFVICLSDRMYKNAQKVTILGLQPFIHHHLSKWYKK